LTRQRNHDRVLAGLERAAQLFDTVKIDMVVMRGVNDDELAPMLGHGARLGAEVRFIEYMDVGGATSWSMDRVVSRHDLLQALEPASGLSRPSARSPLLRRIASRFQGAGIRHRGVDDEPVLPFL